MGFFFGLHACLNAATPPCWPCSRCQTVITNFYFFSEHQHFTLHSFCLLSLPPPTPLGLQSLKNPCCETGGRHCGRCNLRVVLFFMATNRVYLTSQCSHVTSVQLSMCFSCWRTDWRRKPPKQTRTNMAATHAWQSIIRAHAISYDIVIIYWRQASVHVHFCC